MAKPTAFIEPTADNDALVVRCRIGDAAGTLTKVFTALKAGDVRWNSSGPGWFRYELGDDVSVRDGVRILRRILEAGGVEVTHAD